MFPSTLVGLQNKFHVLIQYFHNNVAENPSVFVMMLKEFEHLSRAETNFYC